MNRWLPIERCCKLRGAEGSGVARSSGSSGVNSSAHCTGIRSAIIVTQIDGTPYTSTVGTAVYTTGAAAAATPTFSPVAGSYNTSQSVTISSTTPSSTIYYTTDTTLPTYPISGTTQLYSGPITVSSSENIEAIAVASGDATSAVGSAGYTFNPAAPTFNPIAGILYRRTVGNHQRRNRRRNNLLHRNIGIGRDDADNQLSGLHRSDYRYCAQRYRCACRFHRLCKHGVNSEIYLYGSSRAYL